MVAIGKNSLKLSIGLFHQVRGEERGGGGALQHHQPALHPQAFFICDFKTRFV